MKIPFSLASYFCSIFVRIPLRSPLALVFGLLLASALLCGCSGSSKKEMNTRLPFEEVEEEDLLASVSYFTLKGKLLDSQQIPIPGVRIRVTTPRNTHVALSDQHGNFRISVVHESGQSLDFSFTSSTIRQNYSIPCSAAKIASAEINFSLQRTGRIVPTKVRWNTSH